MLASYTDKINIAVIPHQHNALVSIAHRTLNDMTANNLCFKFLAHPQPPLNY